MFERPKSGEKAVLVHLNFPQQDTAEDLQEFIDLATSAEVEIAEIISGARQIPDPKYFLGTGKTEEVHTTVAANKADVVIVNHALSPAQERNLERALRCRVLDRNGLILDIFAQRARTHEGKLQVELAQLEHISTRLVRGWTHLERQKGGIGLRGPGETQLETDRRLLAKRIKSIQARLEKVRRQRQQSRSNRQKSAIPTVSLVGYTSAGKSSLFNALTDAGVYVTQKLFATLDPTLRAIVLDKIGKVVMADTVGFIRHLPHQLIDAFRATLEETVSADLLLQVIDCADEQNEAHTEQVNLVLAEIGAANIPRLIIYNKIDKLPEVSAHIEYDYDNKPAAVWLSAATGEGLDLLQQAMIECLARERVAGVLNLGPEQGKLRAELYNMKVVQAESLNEQGHWQLEIDLLQQDQKRLWKKYAITEQQWRASKI